MNKKIVIDAYGGDNAPLEVVLGVKKAVENLNDVNIVLCGKKERLEELLEENKVDASRVEIVDAQDVISNDDSPTEAIRNKTESSLVKAFERLKKDENVVGLISAGSTGAILTGGFIKIGRIKGVSRPALSPVLPTLKGKPVLLVDSGANMDCKPINLLHFAIMGSQYLKSMFGVENPKVALLNVGTEDHKGNELIKKVFPLMKELPINFVGNMEARDALFGDVDVIVADGFAGNVLLKSIEGSVSVVMKSLKTDIKQHTASKVGALFMKGTFKRLKQTFDYNVYGGSPFIGVNKTVVKVHGSSKAESFYQAIKQAYQLDKAGFVKNIAECVQNLDIKVEE